MEGWRGEPSVKTRDPTECSLGGLGLELVMWWRMGLGEGFWVEVDFEMGSGGEGGRRRVKDVFVAVKDIGSEGRVMDSLGKGVGDWKREVGVG